MAATTLLLALFAMGQDAKAPGTLVLRDGATTRKDRRLHDVHRVEFSAHGGRVHVKVTFAADLKNGMFTRVLTYVDCDNDKKTGLRGTEIVFVASIGSRYQPNNAEARGAADAPWDMRRCSYKYLRKQTDRGSGTSRLSFFSSTDARLAKPEVDGRTFRYSFPLEMLREKGTRYNDIVQVSVEVEGGISEEVLSLDYVCGGEGLPIEIDGKGSDWPSEGPKATDAVGDMHPAAQNVDIRDLRVEHNKGVLFARVRVAKPVASPMRDDVMDLDRVYLGLEPLGGGYMDYQKVIVWASSRVRPFAKSTVAGAASYAYGVRGRTFEIAVKRRSEQTRFRVMVWADALRRDRIPDRDTAALRIPKGAWK